MTGHAGDDDTGAAGRDDAGELVEDQRGAEQVDVQDLLCGALYGRDSGAVHDLSDGAQLRGRVGEGSHRVGLGHVDDVRGHVVARAAQLLSGDAQCLLAVVGEQHHAADAHTTGDRQTDAARADDDRYVLVHRLSPVIKKRGQ